ncbi:hypothetical protein SCG7086_AG_00200 [Chlamydiales bacterium SCGC AG-110-P3]|nr:hypothetical protein SCG7086_AG_00200 [Chlamydiales bacterium SCGC AG-110-P3]
MFRRSISGGVTLLQRALKNRIQRYTALQILASSISG